MTLEANLIEKRRVLDFTTGEVDPGHVQIRSLDRLTEGPADRTDGVMFRGMGVVAVHALDVPPHGEGDFGRIMDPSSISPVMA
jgi:hypothetical protein